MAFLGGGIGGGIVKPVNVSFKTEIIYEPLGGRLVEAGARKARELITAAVDIYIYPVVYMQNKIREWNHDFRRHYLLEYGLRYDDYYYDRQFDLDIKEAERRLPIEVYDARMQRYLRSEDLALKHTQMPHHLQVLSNPDEPYIRDLIEQVKTENEERYRLGYQVHARSYNIVPE